MLEVLTFINLALGLHGLWIRTVMYRRSNREQTERANRDKQHTRA